MIVNVHHVRTVHASTKKLLHDYIAAQCADSEARARFVDFCHEVWNAQTQQFTLGKFKELFNGNDDPSKNYGDGVTDYPAWEEIAPCLMHFLDSWQQCVHSIVINSTPTGKDEQALYNQDPQDLANGAVMELPGDHLWIVSGGSPCGDGECQAVADTPLAASAWLGKFRKLKMRWLLRDSKSEIQSTRSRCS